MDGSGDDDGGDENDDDDCDRNDDDDCDCDGNDDDDCDGNGDGENGGRENNDDCDGNDDVVDDCNGGGSDENDDDDNCDGNADGDGKDDGGDDDQGEMMMIKFMMMVLMIMIMITKKMKNENENCVSSFRPSSLGAPLQSSYNHHPSNDYPSNHDIEEDTSEQNAGMFETTFDVTGEVTTYTGRNREPVSEILLTKCCFASFSSASNMISEFDCNAILFHFNTIEILCTPTTQ